MTQEEKREHIHQKADEIQKELADIRNKIVHIQDETGYRFPRRVMDELDQTIPGTLAMVIKDHSMPYTVSDGEVKESLGIEEEDEDK